MNLMRTCLFLTLFLILTTYVSYAMSYSYVRKEGLIFTPPFY